MGRESELISGAISLTSISTMFSLPNSVKATVACKMSDALVPTPQTEENEVRNRILNFSDTLDLSFRPIYIL